MTRERVDQWVRANIHVPGRPEWVFVKLWGRAGSSDRETADNLPGGTFERALEYLERRYNDGRSFVLHYVTAREAYNVARAAAAGLNGDPTQYYDYERNRMSPLRLARAALRPPPLTASDNRTVATATSEAQTGVTGDGAFSGGSIVLVAGPAAATR